MKFRLILAACGLLAGVIPAHAQVGGVKVRVPFEFGIANKTLPAGEYVLWSVKDELYLREAGGKTVAMASSNRVARDGGKSGMAVFRCYEKRCFLSQLWMPDADQSRELLESKSEKETARGTEPQQFALLGESSR
jgi:hypothetical protein